VVQGYHISRPLPAEKFTDWLQSAEPTSMLTQSATSR
jgi:EAL domain-containing protein (putative c-di-GMP-specific phosphodiesterase class I)